MTIRHTILRGTLLLFAALLCLLFASPVRADEPGWRQVSDGLEGGTVVALAISPDYATDGLLFAVIDKDDDGRSSEHNDGDRLFRWTGERWMPVYGALAEQYVQQVAFSPNFKTDRKVFVATRNGGIFVSEDAGLTWTQISSVAASFWALHASPNYASDGLIYAGGFKSLYRMENDGSNQTQLATGLLMTDTVRSLAFSPDFGSDNTIFAGTTSSGVVRSTDGGTTWGSIGLAGLWVNALAFAIDGSSTILFAGTGKGVYRSLDNGDSWTAATTGMGEARIESLVVSPDFINDGHLYVSGRGGLYKSVNSGGSWTAINNALLPAEVFSIALHPGYTAGNASLFVGQGRFQGVAVSDDGGSQWIPMNAGLYALSVDEFSLWSNLAEQTSIFAGAYPVGLYHSDDRGASWQSTSGNGLPPFVGMQALAVSPQFDTDRTVFVSGQYKGVYRSVDGGTNWELLNDPDWSCCPEVRHLVISPVFSQDGTVFAGVKGKGIYRLAKNQSGWEKVYETTSGDEVSALAISPNYAADATLFAAVGEQILYSENGGDSWTVAGGGLSSAEYGVIAMPPNFGKNGNRTIYAVRSHSNTIYRSTDGGVSWSALATNLPSGRWIYALVFSPDFSPTDGKMYAGLDTGVYASEDGTSWQALTGGVPVWGVLSLVVSQGLAPKLYAGVDGGSVVQYNLTQPSPNLSCDDTITGSVTLDSDLQCNETALTVNAPAGATIDCAGHTITGSYPAVTTGFGIQVIGSSGVTIRNCTIRNFKTGVAFQGSSGNTLIKSALRGNGIGVWMSSLARAGSEQASADNSVSGNTFSQNGTGLLLGAGADRNRLVGNTIQNSTHVGIDINTAGHILVSGNAIHSNSSLGISLLQADGMTVTANSILSHTVGVSLNGQGGLFAGNTWRNNGTGLDVTGTSANNTLYNNLFSNSTNVSLGPSVGANGWNVAQRSGPNIAGGPSIGGNFWGSPGNGGFSQTCTDTPPDGFCDTANSLGTNNQDQLPLASLTGLADCADGPQWTILVYLNGDNNLDFWTARLFNRLEQVAGNPCIQIHVLWDRGEIGDSNLYWVQPDSNLYALADYSEGVNLWPQGEEDMGNPQTLINFVNRTRSASSAPYTMLSIVGHGNGWSPSSTATPLGYFHTGISFDDSGGGTSLSTDILGGALAEISANGTDPIDLLYLDACLMAMAETLHPLQGFASYVVASENESFTSYPYHRYLDGISSGTGPVDLANTIVAEHHQSLPGYPRTLAAFDMEQMASVTDAINSFADSMLDIDNQIETGLGDGLLAVFEDVQKLDSNVDLLIDDRDGYVDLLHFAALVSQRIGDGAVQNAANTLQNALSAAPSPLIVNSQAASGSYATRSWDLSNANGLSIYLPLGEADWRQDFYNANELSLAEATLWDEFIHALTARKDSSGSARPTPLTTDEDRPGPLPIYDLFLPNLSR